MCAQHNKYSVFDRVWILTFVNTARAVILIRYFLMAANVAMRNLLGHIKKISTKWNAKYVYTVAGSPGNCSNHG
jgi:hypothetical protein